MLEKQGKSETIKKELEKLVIKLEKLNELVKEVHKIEEKMIVKIGSKKKETKTKRKDRKRETKIK